MFSGTMGSANIGLTESVLNPNTLKCIEQYINGYETGLNWPDKWESNKNPGGPWVYGYDKWDIKHYPEYVAKAKQSSEENRVWKIGWKQGHEEKWRLRNLQNP
jgi:hypothetical protein